MSRSLNWILFRYNNVFYLFLVGYMRVKKKMDVQPPLLFFCSAGCGPLYNYFGFMAIQRTERKMLPCIRISEFSDIIQSWKRKLKCTSYFKDSQSSSFSLLDFARYASFCPISIFGTIFK